MNKYCLYGRVDKSFSPAIHNYLFSLNKIEAKYEMYEGEDVIADLRNNIIQGINVTTPYKVSIIEYLDELDPIAKRIGAVNTVMLKGNKLVGYNTDYYGFLDTMEYYNIKAQKAHILGKGGAAKAVKVALADLNIKNCFVARGETIEGDIDLLINATSVLDPLPDEIFNKAKKIIDLHYSKNARKINGLYMLISQAIKAEEIWLNIKGNVEKTYTYFKERLYE